MKRKAEAESEDGDEESPAARSLPRVDSRKPEEAPLWSHSRGAASDC